MKPRFKHSRHCHPAPNFVQPAAVQVIPTLRYAVAVFLTRQAYIKYDIPIRNSETATHEGTSEQ